MQCTDRVTVKKVPEGRFGFCNDTHVAYDKAIMPGCVEEYSFASHSLGGGVLCTLHCSQSRMHV